MSATTQKRMITVRVKRFNPDNDKKPYFQDFELELTPEKTILSALEEIKAEHDGSLTFRRSCRHAICGSCAMMVNRRNTLICTKSLKDAIDRKGIVTIEPLPYLPVIKDLVVDRTVFWEQYQKIKPWLVPPDEVPQKEFRVMPAEVAALENAETCIMCGACYSACPVIATNKAYIGPHALLKALLRIMDPRDTIPRERLEQLMSDHGPYRCHMVLNCIDACPKGLDPAKAIATLAGMTMRIGKIEEERQVRQSNFITPDSIPIQP